MAGTLATLGLTACGKGAEPIEHPEPPVVATDDPSVFRHREDPSLEFVLCPPGEAPLTARDPTPIEIDAFLLQRTLLSRAQLARVRGEAAAADGSLPATGLDWEQAREVGRRLGGDLPTELQWFLAAGRNHGEVPPRRTRSEGPRRVDEGEAGALGLLQMGGNVDEWCRDHYHWPSTPPARRGGDGLWVGNPTFWRVVAGGAWFFADDERGVGARRRENPHATEPHLGIRVAIPVSQSWWEAHRPR